MRGSTPDDCTFALGPEDDPGTEHKSLGEMELEDLEQAVAHCSDEAEREKLEELLQEYRPHLTPGLTLEVAMDYSHWLIWCNPARPTRRPRTRSGRPR